MIITPAHIDACLALLADRRRTNGYADLTDLRAAAKLPAHDTSTEEGAAAKLNEDTQLLDALLVRRNVYVDRRHDSNGTRFTFRA